jgi:hypothetical protein
MVCIALHVSAVLLYRGTPDTPTPAVIRARPSLSRVKFPPPIFEIALSVASAFAVLSWRSAFSTGIGYHTLPASEEALLGGVNDSLLLLMVFAAAVRSVVQPTPPASGLKAAA